MIFIIFWQFRKQYLIENIYARMGLSFKLEFRISKLHNHESAFVWWTSDQDGGEKHVSSGFEL
ncbi:hypothetical protein QF028_006231 [Neobacillus sp. B4I6]|jgi:hypothetical protein